MYFKLRTVMLFGMSLFGMSLVAQKSITDTVKINSATTLLFYSSNPKCEYKDYSFYMKDSANIVKFMNDLQFGKEVFNMVSSNLMYLEIINDKHCDYCLLVQPDLNLVINKGAARRFDCNQLFCMRRNYSIKYRLKNKWFKSESEFKGYFEKIKDDNKLIQYIKPNFDFPGFFYIEITRTTKLPHPLAAMKSVDKKIDELIENEKHSTFVSTTVKPRPAKAGEAAFFTLMVGGSKKVYEILKANGYAVRNWKDNNHQNALFVYKK